MSEAPGMLIPNVLPPEIPALQDDGGADHLTGTRLPDLALPAQRKPRGPSMPTVKRLLWVAAILLVPSVALAEVQWQLSKEQGRPVLRAMSNESEEGDTEFWAQCRADHAFDVGIGADTNVGKGKGEAVTLTLASGGVTATVSGQSRRSRDFEMTAGTELRAKLTRDHALFKVLATGQPIKVSGASRPLTLPAKGLKAKVAALLQACK